MRKYHHERLIGASFKGHNLQGARFSNCDLEKADFSYSNLQDAHFKECRAMYASFANADLKNATFEDNDLSYSVFDKAACSYNDRKIRELCNNIIEIKAFLIFVAIAIPLFFIAVAAFGATRTDSFSDTVLPTDDLRSTAHAPKPQDPTIHHPLEGTTENHSVKTFPTREADDDSTPTLPVQPGDYSTTNGSRTETIVFWILLLCILGTSLHVFLSKARACPQLTII